MAKTGLRSTRIHRSRHIMSGFKKVAVVVNVSRKDSWRARGGMDTGSKAFVACASFKTGGYVKLSPGFEPSKMHGACAYGRNPRAAMASALRKAASKIAKRSGAFAGMR